MVIVGGGPGGYEAALVAAQLGADVTLVDRDGAGGSAVLTDCVPSKTLVATAEVMTTVADSGRARRAARGRGRRRPGRRRVDLAAVERPGASGCAAAQSADIRAGVEGAGVRWVEGVGRLETGGARASPTGDGGAEDVEADVGARRDRRAPAGAPEAQPDGERILTWEQLYDLERDARAAGRRRVRRDRCGVRVGVPGARARRSCWSPRATGCCRARTPTPPQVIEDVFRRRGMEVLSRSRAAAVARDRRRRRGDAAGRPHRRGLALPDGGRVGARTPTGIGLEEAGVALGAGGFVTVDRVSRTSARGVYAAGDCTGVLMLASVAAMQGRIAMWHALGDAVRPLDLQDRVRRTSSPTRRSPPSA